jgi:hypothetical protein
MSSTKFTNGVTLTDDDWFNDVNRLHYTIFNDPADLAAAFNRLDGLTEDTAPDLGADFVVTHDDSAATAKKVLAGRLGTGVLGTRTASTSGTSVDFTGIPSWAKQITIMLEGVSTSGTSPIMVQLGDGAVEATGYVGTVMQFVGSGSVDGTSATTGFQVTNTSVSTDVWHGKMVLDLVEASSFTWSALGVFGRTNSAMGSFVAGSKALSSALDRVRVTTISYR